MASATRQDLSSRTLLALAVGGHVLTNEERDRLEPTELFALAASSIVILTQGEKDKLDGRQLFALAGSQIIKLSERDQAKLTPRAIFALRASGIL
jgi:hypothetical protein